MSAVTLYGLTYTVEVALSAATGSYGAWNTGLWDTATWGPDIIWVDVSQWVRSFTTTRRFSRDLQAWEAGTASVVLDNRDARFNPVNLAGPYVTGGVTQVRPWRPMRIRCTWAGITYDVYRGYVVDWPETYVEPSPNGGDAYVTMACQDELASLARFNGFEQAPVGGGETSGQRIHRILNNAGHAGTRDIDIGRMTMQPTTLASNAVTDLKLTADSEGGAVWVDADGTVVFDGIYALIENTRSNTIQATFGDGPGELEVDEIVPNYNGDLVTNMAAYARQNGTQVLSADAASRALYQDKQDRRTDLMCETDTQVKTLADLWVQRYKDPEYRFSSIKLKPRGSPALLFPQVLGRKVRDLIRVHRRPPGDIAVTRDVFVAGISHTVTGDDMVTVFELWSGSPYTSYTTSRFDTGKWDTATWFY